MYQSPTRCCRTYHPGAGTGCFNITTFASLITALVLPLITLSCGDKVEKTPSADRAVLVDSVFSADSVMIYYQTQGEGDRALVFVHCWCCDRSYWEQQVDEFSQDYTVVTLDLGGHGQSGMNRDEWTMEAFAADVTAVVEKLDLRNVVLIGHSMGGTVIIETARRIPERVAALVGVDTYQDLTMRLSDADIDSFLVPFRADFVATTDRFVRGMFPPTADSTLVRLVAADMSSAPPEVGISAIANVWRYDTRSAFQEMRKPVYSINSGAFATNVAVNRQVAASFEVEIMPHTGHFLHMEDPARFNALLRQTLKKVWPSPTVN